MNPLSVAHIWCNSWSLDTLCMLRSPVCLPPVNDPNDILDFPKCLADSRRHCGRANDPTRHALRCGEATPDFFSVRFFQAVFFQAKFFLGYFYLDREVPRKRTGGTPKSLRPPLYKPARTVGLTGWARRGGGGRPASCERAGNCASCRRCLPRGGASLCARI